MNRMRLGEDEPVISRRLVAHLPRREYMSARIARGRFFGFRFDLGSLRFRVLRRRGGRVVYRT